MGLVVSGCGGEPNTLGVASCSGLSPMSNERCEGVASMVGWIVSTLMSKEWCEAGGGAEWGGWGGEGG